MPNLIELLKKLLNALTQLKSNQTPTIPMPTPETPQNAPQPQPAPLTNAERLYVAAKSWLGRDASPKDFAPDGLGCAETISDIIRFALPELKFPTLLSTRDLFNYLEKSPSFKPVPYPQAGDIVLSVTGSGNGKIAHGHCALTGLHGLMSNDSRSGLFLENYSLLSWNLYFHDRGGMPTHYFRAV